ncbi:MAG: hypothetical protein H0Z38_05240 [Firmicutes bacterium]|nr:hypothetical protein [Bacillota bacterium]
MDEKALKKRIAELNKEIERVTKAELVEYQKRQEAEARHSSEVRTAAPLALFLAGILGFTYAYFALGLGPLAYFFIFAVATPGALWFMISASRIPKWTRWREKEGTIQYLNQLYMEKSNLVKTLRRLERERAKKTKKSWE